MDGEELKKVDSNLKIPALCCCFRQKLRLSLILTSAGWKSLNTAETAEKEAGRLARTDLS